MRQAMVAAAVSGVSALSMVAGGQTISATFPQPTLDRWMYPFASTPGIEESIPVFAALRETGFDDRDAQFLLGFNTGGQIPVGRLEDGYVIESAIVRVSIAVGDRTVYDPTYDSVFTVMAQDDPRLVPDADDGKPIELFAAGFRNGWTAATFLETSPHSPFPPFPPRNNVRNVFAANVDVAGATTDVSNQVRAVQPFEGQPLAIGQTDAVAPGGLLPQGATVSFALDLTRPEVRAYVARALNDGRLRFVISSLEATTGGPGGGTGTPTYPAFISKESPLGSFFAANLELNVRVRPSADLNADGELDPLDIRAFFDLYRAGDIAVDFTMDDEVDPLDIRVFFDLYRR